MDFKDLEHAQAERAAGYVGRTAEEVLADMDQILEEGHSHGEDRD